MNLILNPEYVLKPEQGYALFISKESTLDYGDPSFEAAFFAKIHSVHAAILSCFNGQETAVAVSAAADFLEVPEASIHAFVDKVTENTSDKGVVVGNILTKFPINTLIYSDTQRKDLPQPDEFNFNEPDFSIKRLQSPTDITFMVNTRCATDCIYCYADRRVIMDCQIPLTRIKELIAEARSLHVRAINVIGGEFFLYKNWREMLSYCHKFDYHPSISTKIPISESAIKFLADTGTTLQVSLDTLVKSRLMEMLDVKDDYMEKMKRCLRLLDKHKVKVFIHSVMSHKNDNIDDIDSVFDFLKTLNNIVAWRLDKTAASLYKGVESYMLTKPDPVKLNLQVERLTELYLNGNVPFIMRFDSLISQVPEENTDGAVKPVLSNWQDRAVCSYNYSSLFILPDGKVGGCEELYWNPRFLLGDIMVEGISDLWNSPSVISRYFLKREDLPADSACSSCDSFEKCRHGKGICYRDIIKTYGEDKWFYPDVNCPKAPAGNRQIMVQ